MAHTKGPWHFVNVGENRVSYIMDKHGQSIAEPSRIEDGKNTAAKYREYLANAEFIVRACNSHDDLLEACRRIVDLSAGWNKNGSTGPRHPLSWESVGRVAMDYARYALSKIEEDPNV